MEYTGDNHLICVNGKSDNVCPAHSSLYCRWHKSSFQLAPAIAPDSDGLRSMFFPLRDSTQTTWFSLTSLRVDLCRASVQQSAILAWSRAIFKRAFLCNRPWGSARRAAYLAVRRGLACLNPASVANKSFKPTSMPTGEPAWQRTG